MKSTCEYLIKVPENIDKKEMFDEIDIIAKEKGNCVLLNFESTLKKDVPGLKCKEGDKFFVLVGEAHSAFSVAIQSGREFVLANHVAEEMGLPVTNFETLFEDNEIDFDMDSELDR